MAMIRPFNVPASLQSGRNCFHPRIKRRPHASLSNPARCQSGFSAVAKSSAARNPPEVEVSSTIASMDHSIAIDPIEYIRMPSSLYYFEPDGNIVNYDWMPGKPRSPFGPVFGFYFHFIHPFIVVRDATPRPDYELDFSRSELLMSCREYVLSTAVVLRVHINRTSFG
jgi:hypothetical protein